MRSLQQLQQHYLDKFPHSVQLFHEGDFLAPQQKLLQNICPSLTFREVNIDPPPHIDLSQKHKWGMPRFGVGYRNMCRFFAMGLYPLIQDLDYYMRMDDDSFIGSQVTADPFETMAKSGLRYAWRCTRPERTSSVNGLLRCMQQHDPNLAVKWNRTIFYNNFHIAKPTLWMQEPMKSMLEAIDQHGGIYTQRWGDAPIQSLLVRAYVPQELRHCFTGFKYQHGRHSWPIGR